MDNPPTHFQGKSPLEHLKEARKKGRAVTAETHGLEPSGSAIACFDHSKITAQALLIFWTILLLNDISHRNMMMAIASLGIGLIVAALCRSAYLGWSSLERLHRLIEEERWEIQHHRSQEKEELMELYRAKGFSGEILEQIVETLMADDNRLLEVMLTEELGVPLQIFEHPLKQGVFAGIGAAASLAIFMTGIFIHPVYGSIAGAAAATLLGSGCFAKARQNHRLKAMVWSLSMLALSGGTVFFLGKMLLR